MERTTQGGDAQAGRQATTTLPGVAKRPQLFFFFQLVPTVPRCVYSSLAHIGAVPSLCHFQRHAYRRASRNLRVARPLARPSILPAISIETASFLPLPIRKSKATMLRVYPHNSPTFGKRGEKKEKRRERKRQRGKKIGASVAAISIVSR